MHLRVIKSWSALLASLSIVHAGGQATAPEQASVASTPATTAPRNPAAERLDAVLKRAVDSKEIFGATFMISTGDSTKDWVGAAGVMDGQSRFPLASITKMFTGAVVLKLREQGKLGLDDRISKHLPDSLLKGIHVLDGVDRSGSITIRQLLSHTSGLPDYFTEPCGSEPSMGEIRKTRDMHYTLDDILARTRKMPAHFPPGEAGRAWYSDANYQLLGRIVETVTGKPLGEVYRELVFAPLGLRNTRLQEKDGKADFVGFYHQGQAQVRPLFLAAERATGGIVSDTRDLMVFLRAFFDGRLFPRKDLDEMRNWLPIQFVPMQYGTSLMRLGNLIGHSGSTGTVAYCLPDQGIFIVGATAQLDGARSMMLAVELVQTMGAQFRME